MANPGPRPGVNPIGTACARLKPPLREAAERTGGGLRAAFGRIAAAFPRTPAPTTPAHGYPIQAGEVPLEGFGAPALAAGDVARAGRLTGARCDPP